jgi:hypothetical protein
MSAAFAALVAFDVTHPDLAEASMSIVDGHIPTERATVRARLGQDLQREWRAARDDARMAYRAWNDAPRPQRSEAYVVYVAASDREAAAGHALGRAAAVA